MEVMAMNAEKETNSYNMSDLNRSLAIMAMVVSIPVLCVVANIIYTLYFGGE